MALSEATILPTVASSGFIPKYWPQAPRTAGAICTTVIRSGSAIALKARSVSSRACSAPTGQWVTHWPHRAQLTSVRFSPSRTATVERLPVFFRSHTPSVWMCSHT